jgi:threonylcarbamoyladenosine tRNA methylthiotransferase MtaB
VESSARDNEWRTFDESSPAILFVALARGISTERMQAICADGAMATFFIEQFGCRATQADAAAIERQLLERGYAASTDANSADVVVVNTCTVTAAADVQARQAIHAIHRDNPVARIVVTGCYAQRAPEELATLSGVSWVVGNSHKPEIPRLVQEMTPALANREAAEFVSLAQIARDKSLTTFTRGEPFVQIARGESASPITGEYDSLECGRAQILTGNIREQRELFFAPIQGGEAGHTRPVLKIQDGCDSRCSFCVIPQVRGRSRSLAPGRVVEEIRKLTENGAREIVLSGIDLGSYGRDLKPRAELGELLRRIVEETLIERLRVSSIEPMDVTEDLISLFAASERMARHFHMPLQSGSDRILAAMHRWYRAEHYARHAELVREWLPEAGIGADVIAGFPGETDEDHRATLALIDRLPLAYLHVFSFSPRPGTPAAEMRDHVPAAVIAKRARQLRALGEEKRSAFRAAQVGRTLRVLTLHREGEDLAGPWTRALSGNYIDVRVAGRCPANQFLDVQIAGERDGCLAGVAL